MDMNWHNILMFSHIIVCVLDAGKLRIDCKGQHLSTDELLKKAEEDYEKQVEYIQT